MLKIWDIIQEIAMVIGLMALGVTVLIFVKAFMESFKEKIEKIRSLEHKVNKINKLINEINRENKRVTAKGKYLVLYDVLEVELSDKRIK